MSLRTQRRGLWHSVRTAQAVQTPPASKLAFSLEGLKQALPDTPEPAPTDFYMSAPPGEKYAPGRLLGIVVNGQHVHTGRSDPHVMAVRQLLTMVDADARNPANPGQPQTYAVRVAQGQYTYPYLYELFTTPEQQAGVAPMQGYRPSLSISITRRINEYQAGGGSEVLPIMVGSWGNVNIDPDGGGIRKPPGYGFGAPLEAPVAPVAPMAALDVSDVGAPPPNGKGTGFLYVIANANNVGGVNLGRSVLLIKEKKKKGDTKHLWGPPGGETDKTDHSPLHAALREFSEEVGADWRSIANKAPQIAFVRLQPDPKLDASANEVWAMFTNLSTQEIENAIFKDDRSGWTLTQRINYAGAKDSVGYAFVPVGAVLAADKTTDDFQIGPHTATLRYRWKTTHALGKLP